MAYEFYTGGSRPHLTDEQINSHIMFLKEKYFQVETKWPQFSLLMDETLLLSEKAKSDKTVLILERAYFCGGYSLFAPLFHDANVIAVDCCVSDPGDRWGKQLSWLEDERCVKWRPNFSSKISNLKDIQSESVDIVFIPNVVHHEKDQYGMFKEVSRVLKPSGECSIFEGLVRELHHMPDDYLRYTPEGIKVMFENVGMTSTYEKLGTGVFDVISYVWQQALEYLPEGVRNEREQWFYNEHYPYLQKLDKEYQVNLKNPDKLFPMSYVVRASMNA